MVDTVTARRAGKEAVNAAGEYISADAKAAANAAMAKAYAASSNIGKEALKGGGIADKISGAWNMFGKLMLPVAILGGGAGWAAKKMATGGKAATLLANVGKSTALLNTSTKDVMPAIKSIINNDEHAIVKGAQAVSDKISHYAHKTMGNSKYGAKALNTLKENQLATTVFTVGAAVQGAGSMVFGFKEKAKTLQQMHYDLTGEKISTLRALTGKVDPLVAKARKTEVSSGRAIGATLLEAAGVAGNVGLGLFAKDGGTDAGMRGSMKYMGLSALFGIVPQLGSSVMRSGDTGLKAYNEMFKSFAKEGKADIALYQAVIGGFNKGAPDKMVNEVAQKAFEQQMPPASVLKMLKETNFMQKAPSAAKTVEKTSGKSFVAAENARRASNGGTYAMQA